MGRIEPASVDRLAGAARWSRYRARPRVRDARDPCATLPPKGPAVMAKNIVVYHQPG
jgi:hypothetical protein